MDRLYQAIKTKNQPNQTDLIILGRLYQAMNQNNQTRLTFSLPPRVFPSCCSSCNRSLAACLMMFTSSSFSSNCGAFFGAEISPLLSWSARSWHFRLRSSISRSLASMALACSARSRALWRATTRRRWSLSGVGVAEDVALEAEDAMDVSSTPGREFDSLWGK